MDASVDKRLVPINPIADQAFRFAVVRIASVNLPWSKTIFRFLTRRDRSQEKSKPHGRGAELASGIHRVQKPRVMRDAAGIFGAVH
jgi:hypothetical protein